MRASRLLLCFFFTLSLVAVDITPLVAHAETEEERKARLEKELKVVEQQIAGQQVLVDTKRQERQSLERDLNLLDAEIRKAKLGIQARSIAISSLGDQIEDKGAVIQELNERVGRQRQSLGQLIRKTHEIDDYSLMEVMLGNENLSKFFEDLESFQSIKLSLNESVDILRAIRGDTEEQIIVLEEKQLSEAELKELQEQEKAQIEAKENEKEEILEVTKGQEAVYTAMLEETKKTAAQIRAQLFELSGGGGPIPFPDAVALAKTASAQTGVSAALILAILEQESAYGSHIGSCTYNEIVHNKAVMHPERDQPVFLAMASVIGFDASTQQISCPWIRSGERIGWGGAMGPSQFIPSTWAAYGGIVNAGSGWTYAQGSDVIRQLTGKSSPSSPFNNQDAFMATALLMRDNGASGGTYKAEWTAAIRYFAGWGGASNPINFPYGDNVMTRRARLEGEMQVLAGG